MSWGGALLFLRPRAPFHLEPALVTVASLYYVISESDRHRIVLSCECYFGGTDLYRVWRMGRLRSTEDIIRLFCSFLYCCKVCMLVVAKPVCWLKPSYLTGGWPCPSIVLPGLAPPLDCKVWGLLGVM